LQENKYELKILFYIISYLSASSTIYFSNTTNSIG